jgi:hypothetical protein
MSGPANMSQFIESLKKKSRALKAEQAELYKRMTEDQNRFNAINGAIAGIDALLRVDGVTPETDNPTPSDTIKLDPSAAIISTKAPELYEVLSAALQDQKPHKVDELLTLAKTRGVDFGSKDPYKAVSMTLLGISRGKKFKHHENGTFQKVVD